MLWERVRLDARSELMLMRSSIRAKSSADAAAVLRAAGNLPGGHPALMGPAHLAQPKGGLPVDTVSEAIEAIARTCGDQKTAVDLMRDLKVSNAGSCALCW